MSTPEELWEAQRLIEKQWRADLAPEEARILGFTRDALDFISSSGQRHRFRDYRQHEPSSQPHGSPWPEGDLEQAENFFRKRLAESPPPDERELLQVIISALQFISMTGQLTSLRDYIQHLEEGAPPYVVAAFGSLDEAEEWLENHPDPPDFAHIIVADEYRSVFHDRQSNVRKLPNDNALEYYLAELREAEPPVPLASFATRQDAESWLRARSEQARRVWISIGGGLYLAAYYPNLNHGALFPL